MNIGNNEYNEYGYMKSGDAAWAASRKAAGAAIDIETCGVGCWYARYFDTYYTGIEIEQEQMVEQLFVCGPESDGWISEYDLPSEKRRDLYARGAREDAKEAKEKGIPLDQLHRADDLEIPF